MSRTGRRFRRRSSTCSCCCCRNQEHRWRYEAKRAHQQLLRPRYNSRSRDRETSRIRDVGKAHLQLLLPPYAVVRSTARAVGKINGSMRSKSITYSYCSSGAIVARRSGKAGKMSWKRAIDSCFSHDTPLPKLREDV